MQLGDTIDLSIDGLAFGGKGVARESGLVFFVSGGLPGDRVRARVTAQKKRFAEAVAEAVLEPSAQRVEPFCPHFGHCGGCALQDFNYSAQLHWKERWVAEALRRIGGFADVPVSPILASPDVRDFRNKMEFAFQGQGQDLRLGLRRRAGHDVVDLGQCRVFSPLAGAILAAAREHCAASGAPAADARGHGFWRHLVLRRSSSTGRILALCITSPDREHFAAAKQLGKVLSNACPEVSGYVHGVGRGRGEVAVFDQEAHAEGDTAVTESLCGLTFQVSAGAFFQTNTAGAEVLYRAVSGLLGLSGSEVVYDLYCGSGGIALGLARNAARVFGFELLDQAVADAKANARANGISNCRFKAGRIGPKVFAELPRPDVLVCDPPRTGMDQAVAEAVLDLGPERVAAVSCDPATLARDAARLSPRYELAAVQPVDMFPHAAHVEAVALLRRR